MPFVPSGYLSIHEALNRLGRELFPSAWTGEEHKAPRGLISEEEWSRIKDLPPPRGGGAGMETPRGNPARKAAPDSSLDPSDPLNAPTLTVKPRSPPNSAPIAPLAH